MALPLLQARFWPSLCGPDLYTEDHLLGQIDVLREAVGSQGGLQGTVL